MLSPERAFVTVEEALKIVPIHRATLYRMFSAGTLPTRKFGRRTLIPRDAWEQYLADLPAGDHGAGRVKAPGAAP